MALHRDPPTCIFCGKIIAKARYQDQSNIPMQMRLIGDTFIEWVYSKHECKGLKDMHKEIKFSL